MKKRQFAIAAVLAIGCFTAVQAQETPGTYKRANGDLVQVTVSGGKLFCKIVSGKQAGFEMCHGMAQAGPNTWQGAEMKHPGMPSIMTFNGTVTVTPTGLTIKGCAIGQSMCDSETWTRQK